MAVNQLVSMGHGDDLSSSPPSTKPLMVGAALEAHAGAEAHTSAETAVAPVNLQLAACCYRLPARLGRGRHQACVQQWTAFVGLWDLGEDCWLLGS